MIITAGNDIDLQLHQDAVAYAVLTLGSSHASDIVWHRGSEIHLEMFKQHYLHYGGRSFLNTFEFFITHRSMVYFLTSITEIFESKWEETVHEILTGSH